MIPCLRWQISKHPIGQIELMACQLLLDNQLQTWILSSNLRKLSHESKPIVRKILYGLVEEEFPELGLLEDFTWLIMAFYNDLRQFNSLGCSGYCSWPCQQNGRLTHSWPSQGYLGAPFCLGLMPLLIEGIGIPKQYTVICLYPVRCGYIVYPNQHHCHNCLTLFNCMLV